jgi:glycosyltransferase involved in cell wall biosynthesis
MIETENVKEKLPISVIILTYNEEDNIEKCLKSVYSWTDEVFIVDSFSTDKTLEIVKKYTDKIYQHEFTNYSEQRNWAQKNLPLKNELVFHIDADEWVTDGLKKELFKIFQKGEFKRYDGFLISRKTIFYGKWIKHGGHFPRYHLRIFKKHKGRCEKREYDQHFIVEGNIKKLKSVIVNDLTQEISEFIKKHLKWAKFEAETIVREKQGEIVPSFKGNPVQKMRWLRKNIYGKMPLFIRPFLYFFYRYFIRLGFLDGVEGLIFHFIQGFWFRFMVDVKIWEMKKAKIELKC